MPRRFPLDAELIRRGLAADSAQARQLIESGRVLVAGRVTRKASTVVDHISPLVVRAEAQGERYVSRGGHKLAGALDTFSELSVKGRRCLDAGACTGGFTEVLLRRGALDVAAVDVAYGELAWSLRNDPRVRVFERTNVRHLKAEDLGGPVDLVVADLSFISLRTVLPALIGCVKADGDMLPMVKPQFEVRREQVPPGGVVRDPIIRAEAVLNVIHSAEKLGWGAVGVVASQLPGPAGNVEFFVWLRAGASRVDDNTVVATVTGGVA